ncbi:MAG: sigma-70 family RNA polymerase sigma factor [Planctomycetales bacterium]
MSQSTGVSPQGAASRSAEEDLLASLRAGDQQAYERVVRAHGGRLLSVARRLMHQEQDAQDAVQDAFLSAFRSLDQFDGQSLLSTWLHRIVVNACLMKLRTRRRKPEQSLEALLPRFKDDGHQLDPPAPWSEPAEVAAQRVETREFVRRSIAQLPESYRTVLLLRDIEELDTEETARMLEVSIPVVKTRLHRARQALRTLLDRHFHGGEA